MRKTRALLVASLFAAVLIPAAPAQAASCPPGDETDHYAVGGRDSGPGYANKANVLVNDIAGQTFTWRAVGVFQDSNNFVEMGWSINEDLSPNDAHPYRSWVNNGIINSGTWASINVPQGPNSYKEFGVRDTNDDNLYNFMYNGSDIGDEKWVSIPPQSAFSLSESESFCSSDILRARFVNLRGVHSQGGTWVQYNSLFVFISYSYQSQWSYGNESINTYHVCKVGGSCTF